MTVPSFDSKKQSNILFTPVSKGKEYKFDNTSFIDLDSNSDLEVDQEYS